MAGSETVTGGSSATAGVARAQRSGALADSFAGGANDQAPDVRGGHGEAGSRSG